MYPVSCTDLPLHTVICDQLIWQAWLQAFGSSYRLAATRQHLIDIYHVAPHGGTIRNQNWDNMLTEPYPFTGIGSFTMAVDDSPSRPTRDLLLYWNPNQSCVQTGNWTRVDCMAVQEANHSASDTYYEILQILSL